MALEEEQSSAAQEMRRAIDCLRDCADLAGLDTLTLEALAAGAVYFSLPAGSSLFESDATSDGVYLVASGRLGVQTAGNAGWTAEIERGELVGESAWLLKERRSAGVVALRDSELLLVPNLILDAIAEYRFAQLAGIRSCNRGRIRLRTAGARGAPDSAASGGGGRDAPAVSSLAAELERRLSATTAVG